MNEPRTEGNASPPPEGEQLAAHRDYLFRFALVHLRDPARAEDAVQETLLAAMESRSAFSGRAQLRTWLTGILKHKIVDVFRRQSREAPLEDFGELDRSSPRSSSIRRTATTGAASRRTGGTPRNPWSKSASGRCSTLAAKPCRRKPPGCSQCAS
jgi:DNA-directed RNA polymerase specialized sigma24 family protein